MKRQNYFLLLCVIVCSIVLSLFFFCSCSQSKCEHVFGAWEISKKATHLETGERRRSCNNCGEIETEIIEKEDSPYTKLKNYLIKNGQQEDGSYIVLFGKTDVGYWGSSYSPADNGISFLVYLGERGTVILNLEESSTSATWTYFMGNYEAAGKYNIADKTITKGQSSFPSSMKNTVLNAVQVILGNFYDLFNKSVEDAGITLLDLGFKP